MRNTDLTPEIIGCAIKIHRRLGPGLLESAYESCLAYELTKLGLCVERQKPVPLIYDSVKLDCGFRADLVVEGRVVIETKCREALHPVDEAQLLSHLRLLNISVGLLINFHVVLLKDGIKRMVNNYRDLEEAS
ncbi:MAG: GxxExxY protein [Terriglobales bacterium]